MTTREIAEQLKAYCENGEFESAQRELYSNDIESIEPVATPDFEQVTKGLDNVIKKGKKFEEMTQDTHELQVSEPVIAGNAFAFTLTMDITMKGRDRMKMSEVCVYTVKDGKVVSEQFFM